jgi:hypothetical protein
MAGTRNRIAASCLAAGLIVLSIKHYPRSVV